MRQNSAVKQMSLIKLTTVNLACRPGDLSQNLSGHRKWLEKTGDTRILLFPELSLTGYVKNREWLLSHRKMIQQTLDDLAVLTRETGYQGIVLAGAPLFRGGNIIIAHYVLYRGEILHIHEKNIPGPSERSVFSPGKTAEVLRNDRLPFKLPFHIGIQICAETHFPEISGRLADKGAGLLLMPFASPRETGAEKLMRMKKYLPARAYDNTCFIASCNQIWDRPDKGRSPAASLIINPRGDILAEAAGMEESFCSFRIEPEDVMKIRTSRMGYFRDWI